MSKKEKAQRAVNRLKKLAREIYVRQPFSIQRTEDGIKLRIEGYNYDVRKDDNYVFLCVMDGQVIDEIIEVEKLGDDLVLKYDDKHCAITSKPLVIRGTQIYFTKHGFTGTIPLNEATLLAGDIYNPDVAHEVKRKISKEVVESDKYDLGIDSSELETGEDGEYYLVTSEEIGDVEALIGSKATLKDMSEGKLMRELLNAGGINKKQLILAVGAGVTLGVYFYPYIVGG